MPRCGIVASHTTFSLFIRIHSVSLYNVRRWMQHTKMGTTPGPAIIVIVLLENVSTGRLVPVIPVGTNNARVDKQLIHTPVDARAQTVSNAHLDSSLIHSHVSAGASKSNFALAHSSLTLQHASVSAPWQSNVPLASFSAL